MTSYAGRHAELYDLFYGNKPYAAEAEFVHDGLIELSPESGRRLLELACGTGRHAAEFHRLGWEVVGVDHSASMLACAQQRFAYHDAAPRFICQDLRAIDLSCERFDVATCLFDSIGYLVTNASIGAALRAIHRHLRPGGLLTIEFWHAPAMLRHHEPVRVRRWPTAGGEVVRISQTSLDYERQTGRVAYTVLELSDDGRYSRVDETQENRFFSLAEMTLLLEQAGFTCLRVCAGFSQESRVTDETWHVVLFARR